MDPDMNELSQHSFHEQSDSATIAESHVARASAHCSGCPVEDETAPGKNLFNLSEPCGEQRLFLFLNRHVELRIRHPSLASKVVTDEIETVSLQDVAHLRMHSGSMTFMS